MIVNAISQNPAAITNDLAVYQIGRGKSLLLMAYPQASAYHPMAESPLVKIFDDLGYSVFTFDPPGIYKSERKANVTLQELFSCPYELLDYFKITDRILLVGHSQSGFSTLAYAIEFPERIKKMILTGKVN